MPTTGNDSGFIPSSLVTVSFTDIATSDIEVERGLQMKVWTKQSDIPYFSAIHNYEPEDLSNYNSSRAFPSYAVHPNGESIVIAGGIIGDEKPFTGLTNSNGQPIGYHDTFAIVNNNCGEPGSWEINTFNLEFDTPIKREDMPKLKYFMTEEFDPENPEPAEGEEKEWAYYSEEHEDLNYFWMSSASLSHKFVAYDDKGNINFPVVYYVSFADSVTGWPFIDDDIKQYWYPRLQVLHNVKFNPSSKNISLYQIHPPARKDNPVSRGNLNNPPKIPFQFATARPQYFDYYYFDDEFDPEEDADYGENGYIPYMQGHFPYWHPEYKAEGSGTLRFNINQARSTYAGPNGERVMLWLDSMKAAPNHDDPVPPYANPNYFETPEIMLAATMDGEEWSEAYSFSPVDFPELAFGTSRIITSIYPADELEILGDNKFRLYFYYYADAAWGSYANTGPTIAAFRGSDGGGHICFAAMDFELKREEDHWGNVSDSKDKVVPEKIMPIKLSQNYPNPFNPSTLIRFNIPTAGEVKLNVYNIKGQLVKTLVNENMITGNHEITWNGDDNNNRSVASGVYFYRLEANGQNSVKKMLLMK
jgi:hypothetical protein